MLLRILCNRNKASCLAQNSENLNGVFEKPVKEIKFSRATIEDLVVMECMLIN